MGFHVNLLGSRMEDANKIQGMVEARPHRVSKFECEQASAGWVATHLQRIS